MDWLYYLAFLLSHIIAYGLGYKMGKKITKDHYRIDDLVIGGNCGLCGSWIPNTIVPMWWRWDICENCINESEE
jgi:hypothetical protein